MAEQDRDDFFTLVIGAIIGTIISVVLTIIASHIFMFEHNIGDHDTVCIKLTTAYDPQTDIGGIPASTVVERCFSYNELKRFALEDSRGNKDTAR